MRPASSSISASIIPGLSLKSAIVARPVTTASAASLLQPGHSESVFLGIPAVIWILSRLLSNWPGAQDGRGNCPWGRIALTLLENNHARFDAARRTWTWSADMGHLPPVGGYIKSGWPQPETLWALRRSGCRILQRRQPVSRGFCCCAPAKSRIVESTGHAFAVVGSPSERN